MASKDFIDGNYDTHFIENNQEQLMLNNGCEDCSDMVIVAAFIDYLQKISSRQEFNKDFAPPQSRWKKIPYVNHF